MIALDSSIYIYHDPAPARSVIEWIHDFEKPASSIVLAQPELLSLEGRKMINKIKSFKSLSHDWDSYGAAAPSAIAVEDALSFVRSLDERGYAVYFAAPGPDGQILVELKNQEKSVEITFSEDEPASFAKFTQVTCVEEGELTPENTSSILLWLHS